MANKPQTVTSIGIAPEQERRSRMIKYAIAMTIRSICVILAVVVQGWAVWIFIAGAVLLPYFAVVLANAHDQSGNQRKHSTAIAPTLTIDASAFERAAESKS
ncbi:MAG: DUF3099 domain-containing protein [Micrococcales bacterium]